MRWPELLVVVVHHPTPVQDRFGQGNQDIVRRIVTLGQEAEVTDEEVETALESLPFGHPRVENIAQLSLGQRLIPAVADSWLAEESPV
jgi:energy-coupling factor transporter ATP-binding protein EcfA2